MADIKTVLRKHTSPGVYSALIRMRHALSGPKNVRPDSAPNVADLASLGQPFADALASMYRGDPQLGNDGQAHQLSRSTTRIPMAEGLWLYSLCKDAKAQRTMEIGCAYGFSTLYFLAALKSNHGSLHIAVDPHEHGTSWKGIGARNVQAVGMESSFRLLEEISALAIPRLIGEGLLFDLIFVDGNHRFDDVLLDFTLSALACKPGGYVILDDTWMPSVRKTVSFVRRNRVDFTELPGANPRAAAFQRTGNDQRDWNHYQSF